MKYILGVLLVLFASYADIFLYRVGINPAPPASFLIPLFIILFFIKYPIKDFFDILKTHTFKLFLLILFLSIVYGAFSPVKSSIIIQNISLNTITLLLYVLTLHYFRSEDKKTVFLVILFSFIVLAGSVFYDFFIGLPKFSTTLEQMVRKGGFGENPNKAASGIKFLALCGLVLLAEHKKKRYLLVAAMVISVFLTFSRSGTVSVVLILMLGTMNNWSNTFQLNIKILFTSFFRLIFLFAILYTLLLSFAGIIRENFPAFTRGAAGERMDLLLGQSEKSAIAEDTGAGGGGRGDLFLSYLNSFMDNPIGYGTGYTSDKKFNRLSTHNYYLYLAINFGIISIILYLVYLFYGLNLSIKQNQFYYFIFISLIMFEGLISHSVYFERTILICLAFFDSLIYRKPINSVKND